MVNNKAPVGSEMVAASYAELVSFLRYYRHFGTPIIIGGWAVYFYNPYYGSVDIDVVGRSFKGGFDGIIEGYERSHGYEIIQQDLIGTAITASKPIVSKKTGEKIGDMEIDACSYERAGASEFHEDESKKLPYSLCEDDGCKKEVRLEKDCICYVPSKALLTLFKVKARRDRSYDIRTKGATMNPQRLEWLKGKVVKDGSDIIALLDPEEREGVSILSEQIDYRQMKELASKSDLTELVVETLQEVLSDREALRNYGRTVNTKSLLKQVADLKA
ncbi:MAG: hypothetical protein M1503_03215 [Thaumarchaeota archaeon]|nr:hypothetical protein [Nitrososphaerota archaeon]MCL5317262.1 hypothetical protein [Nitrososphaerota archaeon]